MEEQEQPDGAGVGQFGGSGTCSLPYTHREERENPGSNKKHM